MASRVHLSTIHSFCHFLLRSEGRPFQVLSGIAVLYRCNFQSRVIEETLQQHKIPYEIQNGLCFYDRREVRILLDYLRFISNPYSEKGDDALRSIINVPNRYIGRKFIRDLENFQAETDKYLYEKLISMPVELVYLRKSVQDFIKFMDPLIDDADTAPINQNKDYK